MTITKHNFSGWTPEQIRKQIDFYDVILRALFESGHNKYGYYVNMALDQKQAAQEALDDAK